MYLNISIISVYVINAAGFGIQTADSQVESSLSLLAPRPSWLDSIPLCRTKRLILIKMLVYEFLTQALGSKLVKAEDGMQHYAGQN